MGPISANFFKKIYSPALVLISSLLLFLSTPGFSVWPMAFIALIPFFLALNNAEKARTAAFYGFLFGFSFYCQLLYWLIPTMKAGGVALPMAFVSLSALATFLSTEFIITACLSFYFKKLGSFPWALVLASTWTMIDFLKLQVNKIALWFPWFSMAMTQTPKYEFLRWAFYTGIYGFSFFMVFFQALISHSIKNFRATFLKIFIYATAIVFLFFFPMNNLSSGSESIRIALLQPSIELYKKWDIAYESEVKDRLKSLALLASKEKPDLIVWPENALPGWIDDKEIFSWLSSLIKETETFHMVGSVSRIDARHVAVFLLSPQGEIKAEYYKRELVPFGEYVPMRNFLGKYVKALGAMGEFEEGVLEQPLMKVKEFNIGPSICYESIFDYLFDMQAKKGADIFVNITNDGWYFDTFMPKQHLSEAQLRAAENGIPLARAANNGISAFIGPRGEIIKSTKLNEKTFIIADIEKRSLNNSTFPKRFFIYISLITLLSFLIARILI